MYELQMCVTNVFFQVERHHIETYWPHLALQMPKRRGNESWTEFSREAPSKALCKMYLSRNQNHHHLLVINIDIVWSDLRSIQEEKESIQLSLVNSSILIQVIWLPCWDNDDDHPGAFLVLPFFFLG